jgi:hypothetical protein
MQFEELDEVTRRHMLAEFDREQQEANPYVGRGLSRAGIEAFRRLMRAAITDGNEESLRAGMARPEYWLPTETYVLKGVSRERKVNIAQATERLCLTEFNTWYVRGLAARLAGEGVTRCQAYRAANPKWEPGDCAAHEGQVYTVQEIYDGHRRRYWPEPGDQAAASIPFGPGCHHTIRRVD